MARCRPRASIALLRGSGSRLVICDSCSVRRSVVAASRPQGLSRSPGRYVQWSSNSSVVRYVPLWSAAACPRSGLAAAVFGRGLHHASEFVRGDSVRYLLSSKAFFTDRHQSTSVLFAVEVSRGDSKPAPGARPTGRGGKQRRQARLAAGRPPHSTRDLLPLSGGAYTRAKSCPSGHTLQRTASPEAEPTW